MEKLDAKTQPVGTLLAQDNFFRVPEYQRPFSWDADNFENLIDDIIEASKEQEYFLGTIVLHHQKKYLKSRVSDYPRSIQVLKYADWDRSTIDKRTQEATDLILQDP